MRIGHRQIRVSILFKMLVVFLLVIATFACWWCYWALPKFQADKMQDAEVRTQNAVELAWGALNYVYQMEQSGLVTTRPGPSLRTGRSGRAPVGHGRRRWLLLGQRLHARSCWWMPRIQAW